MLKKLQNRPTDLHPILVNDIDVDITFGNVVGEHIQ